MTYVTGDHSYVLIRVARHRTMAKIGDDHTDLTSDQITLHDVVMNFFYIYLSYQDGMLSFTNCTG